jgi:phage terminase small subunit
MILTAKQEMFVLEWFATGNKTEAYRRVYNAQKMSDKPINENASNLAKTTKVLSRYRKLTAEAQARNNTDVDEIDSMLKNPYTVAEQDRKPAAMVSTAIGLSKLYGLDAEMKLHMKAGDGTETLADALTKLAERLPN